MPALSTDTPCIGICSTIYGDEVCRGCRRNFKEVIDWNGYDASQKRTVLERLESQLKQHVAEFLEVTDSNQLASKLKKHGVKYRQDFHPLCWAYTLLREGADKIRQLERFGIQVQPPYQHLSPNQLFQQLDDQLYQQAESHYKASVD